VCVAVLALTRCDARAYLVGDREVQRTMLELLNQLDGFSSDDKIKVVTRAHDAHRT
jgi:ATP-dependent 26S proteasome regulatory subunit